LSICLKRADAVPAFSRVDYIFIVKSLAPTVGSEHPGTQLRGKPTVQDVEAVSGILAGNRYCGGNGCPGLGDCLAAEIPGKCGVRDLMAIPLSDVLAGKARKWSSQIGSPKNEGTVGCAVESHFAFRPVVPGSLIVLAIPNPGGATGANARIDIGLKENDRQ
jgi:hypothetical protein